MMVQLRFLFYCVYNGSLSLYFIFNTLGSMGDMQETPVFNYGRLPSIQVMPQGSQIVKVTKYFESIRSRPDRAIIKDEGKIPSCGSIAG